MVDSVSVNEEHSSKLSNMSRTETLIVDIIGSDLEEHVTDSENKVMSDVAYYGCVYCSSMFESIVEYEEHLLLCSKDGNKKELDINNMCSAEILMDNFGNIVEAIKEEDISDVEEQEEDQSCLKQCTVCWEKVDEGDFEGHTKMCNKKKYKCDKCGKVFIRVDSYKYHMKYVHLGIKPHECTICKRRFSLKYYLTSHMRTHTDERPYVCLICKKAFRQYATLHAHQRVHTKEQGGASNIKKRKVVNMDVTSLKLCNKCGVEINIRSFARHFRNCQRTFVCHKCGKVFYKSDSFEYHMKHVHNGVKEHMCEVCSRKFSLKTFLVNHMRTHTGERPFVCDVCGRAFRQSSTLRSHKKVHEYKDKYVCEICGFQTQIRSELKRHKDMHPENSEYVCDVCNRKFVLKSTFNRHKTTHSNHCTWFYCDHCPAQFKLKRYFDEHVSKHVSTEMPSNVIKEEYMPSNVIKEEYMPSNVIKEEYIVSSR